MKGATFIESAVESSAELHTQVVLFYNREKHERPRDPVHIDVIREVAKAVSIPVIANGVSVLVKTFEDIEKYRLETGCSSVMLARAAQWNPSIFKYVG